MNRRRHFIRCTLPLTLLAMLSACGGGGGGAPEPYNWSEPQLVGVLEPPAPAQGDAYWYFGLDAMAPAGPGAAALFSRISLQGCDGCDPSRDMALIVRASAGDWSVLPPLPEARRGFDEFSDAVWAPSTAGMSVMFSGRAADQAAYQVRTLQQGAWSAPRTLAQPEGATSWIGPFRSRDGSYGQVLVYGSRPGVVGYAPGTGWQAPVLLPVLEGTTSAAPLTGAVFDDGRAVAVFRLRQPPAGGSADRTVSYRYVPGTGWSGPDSVPSGEPASFLAAVPTNPQGEAFFEGMSCTDTACSITLTRYQVDTGWGQPLVLHTRSRSDPESLENGSVHAGTAGQVLAFWMDRRPIDAVQSVYRTFARLYTPQSGWGPTVQAPDGRLGADTDTHGEAVAFTPTGQVRISSRLGLSSFDGTAWQVHGSPPPVRGEDQHHILEPSGQATVLWREAVDGRGRIFISRSRFP